MKYVYFDEYTLKYFEMYVSLCNGKDVNGIYPYEEHYNSTP